jgi:nucleotide-binding universal stress UspA family protein
MSDERTAERRVVVGIDASAAAQAALRWAISYAELAGAEVVAVHAFEAPVYFSYSSENGSPVMLDSPLRDGVRRCFEDEWCAPLAASGVRHRTVMADGNAASVLLDVAERECAELLVSGRRGLNTLGELVLGSVSHRLVQGSQRPVVLVPAAESEAA